MYFAATSVVRVSTLDDHLFTVRVSHGSSVGDREVPTHVRGEGKPPKNRSITSDYITELLQDEKLLLYSTHANGQWTVDTVEFRKPSMWDFIIDNKCCDGSGCGRA